MKSQISSFTRRVLLISAVLIPAIAANPVHADEFNFQIDPRATYLHLTENQDSLALGTVPIDLKSIGINGGDFITIQGLGDFSFRGQNNSPDVVTDLIGVFSSSAELLPSQEFQRITGAIDFGADVITTPVESGFDDNDIAEDFLIGHEPFHFQVPDLAQFFFVAAKDQYWSDNADPDGDFALKIITEFKPPENVPEPASIVGTTFALGSGFLLRRKKRKKR